MFLTPIHLCIVGFLCLTSVNPLSANPTNLPEIQNSSTLQYVLVMTRHGSRSPSYTYPTDPYPFTNSTFWPDGPLELTNYGKQQLFRTGKLLRQRYSSFLNEDYRVQDNKILSNKFNRDFDSAACLLSGLYPPSGHQIWNKDILWQPIPIWEDPYDIAYMFDGNFSFCPRFGLEMMKALGELNYKNMGKHETLFNYLSKNMETKIQYVSDMTNVWDVLHLEQQNGYKLPEWTNEVYPQNISGLHAESFRTLVAGTPDMIRLGTGPIMKMISDQLMKKAKGKLNPDARLYVNAGHDATLQGILSALGFTESFAIDTSAFIIFELHKFPSSELTVQFLYFNNSDTPIPNVLDPPNCPNPCPLEKFNKFVLNLNPEDWKEACKIPPSAPTPVGFGFFQIDDIIPIFKQYSNDYIFEV